MAIEQRIKEILERELPDSMVEVDRDSVSGKVGGRIIWKGFYGLDSLRRQKNIFGRLRKHLSWADEQTISFIFSYTPEEYETVTSC